MDRNVMLVFINNSKEGLKSIHMDILIPVAILTGNSLWFELVFVPVVKGDPELVQVQYRMLNCFMV